MAQRNPDFPITMNELFFIISIFLIAFGGILNSIVLLYLGIFIMAVLIIEKLLKVLFNPGGKPLDLLGPKNF
jgi:hypothetical protein